MDLELSDDQAPDRAERIEALAAIPEQIVRFLAERLEDGLPEREPMLEVLVRRHYREFDLHDLRVLAVAGPAHAQKPKVKITSARVGLPPEASPELPELRPPVALKLQVGLDHGEVVDEIAEVIEASAALQARLDR